MNDAVSCEWKGARGPMISTYAGNRDSEGRTAVSVDGNPLGVRADLRSASATSFDWGYAGLGGPAQLALAILAHHLRDDSLARRYHEHFMRAVIRHLPSQWTLSGSEIDAALPAEAWWPIPR